MNYFIITYFLITIFFVIFITALVQNYFLKKQLNKTQELLEKQIDKTLDTKLRLEEKIHTINRICDHDYGDQTTFRVRCLKCGHISLNTKN